MAVDDLSEAIKLRPNQADLFYMRGIYNSAIIEIDQAIADFSFAIKLNPSADTYYFARGQTFLSDFKFAKAIADFNKAIQLNPDNAAASRYRDIAKKEFLSNQQ